MNKVGKLIYTWKVTETIACVYSEWYYGAKSMVNVSWRREEEAMIRIGNPANGEN